MLAHLKNETQNTDQNLWWDSTCWHEVVSEIISSINKAHSQIQTRGEEHKQRDTKHWSKSLMGVKMSWRSFVRDYFLATHQLAAHTKEAPGVKLTLIKYKYKYKYKNIYKQIQIFTRRLHPRKKISLKLIPIRGTSVTWCFLLGGFSSKKCICENYKWIT